MVHRLYSAAGAAVLLAFSFTARADEAPADARPASPSTPARRSFGERGDIVLQDVIGARTSRVATSSFVSPGLAQLAGLGGLAMTGPSVSAAWLDVTSVKTGLAPAPTSRVTTLRFEPSADVFVARHVSIGGTLGFETSRAHLPSGPAPAQRITMVATALSADPRVGYVVPLTDSISLWPRARAGVTLRYGFAPRTFRVGADLPLVIRVSSHVLLDVGPELTYAVTDLPPLGVLSQGVHVGGRGGLSLTF